MAGWATSYSKSFDGKIRSLINLYSKCAFYALIYCGVIFFVDRELFKVVDIPHYFTLTITTYGNYWSEMLGSFWFLTVYFPVNFIFSGLLKTKIGYQNIIVFLLGCLGYIWFKYYPSVFGVSTTFFFYGLLFVLGYIMKGYFIKDVKILMLLLGGGFVSLLISFYFNKMDFINGDMNAFKAPPTLTYLIYACFAIFLILYFKTRIRENKFTNLISWFGKNSIWIYFGQTYALTLGYYIEPKIDLNWKIKIIIMFTLQLILSVVIAIIFQKLYSVFEMSLGKIKVFFSSMFCEVTSDK